MQVEAAIRALAQSYRVLLKAKIEIRIAEMAVENTDHLLLYQVLGISPQQGKDIDIYQNTGRFLYRYAGEFMEQATLSCFRVVVPEAKPVTIPNPFSGRPATFQIDCLVGLRAYEIKWRDATTDGDHIVKEHARIKAIATAGYTPIRLMYFYPNRKQAQRIQSTLEDLYKANDGYYYHSSAAWSHVYQETGVDLKALLEAIAQENDG